MSEKLSHLCRGNPFRKDPFLVVGGEMKIVTKAVVLITCHFLTALPWDCAV